MPQCKLDYGLVGRTDGGTYDWQTADRSRGERDAVTQHNTVLAGSLGTVRQAPVPPWRLMEETEHEALSALDP